MTIYEIKMYVNKAGNIGPFGMYYKVGTYTKYVCSMVLPPYNLAQHEKSDPQNSYADAMVAQNIYIKKGGKNQDMNFQQMTGWLMMVYDYTDGKNFYHPVSLVSMKRVYPVPERRGFRYY